MQLFVVDAHLLFEELSAEPPEHIGVEEASETKDYHDYGKEDVGMGYVVRVAVRRLPLALADHYAHYEEKKPFAHVGQNGKGVYRRSMALLTHVVEVVVVQQDSVEKEADRPRKTKQLGKDVSDEADDEQKASFGYPFVLGHEPHLLRKVNGED